MTRPGVSASTKFVDEPCSVRVTFDCSALVVEREDLRPGLASARPRDRARLTQARSVAGAAPVQNVGRSRLFHFERRRAHAGPAPEAGGLAPELEAANDERAPARRGEAHHGNAARHVVPE